MLALCSGSDNALNGCINDAKCMQYLLKSKFGFRDEDITVLTDDQSDPAKWPTGNNMRAHMRQLVANAQPGDSLVFHFSGGDSAKSDSSRQRCTRTKFPNRLLLAARPCFMVCLGHASWLCWASPSVCLGQYEGFDGGVVLQATAPKRRTGAVMRTTGGWLCTTTCTSVAV